jgi:hypothetical protein
MYWHLPTDSMTGFPREIEPASGYIETWLHAPTAGDRRRTGKRNAMAEDLTHTAGTGGAAVVETSAPPASPPGYELRDEIGRGGMASSIAPAIPRSTATWP